MLQRRQLWFHNLSVTSSSRALASSSISLQSLHRQQQRRLINHVIKSLYNNSVVSISVNCHNINASPPIWEIYFLSLAPLAAATVQRKTTFVCITLPVMLCSYHALCSIICTVLRDRCLVLTVLCSVLSAILIKQIIISLRRVASNGVLTSDSGGGSQDGAGRSGRFLVGVL